MQSRSVKHLTVENRVQYQLSSYVIDVAMIRGKTLISPLRSLTTEFFLPRSVTTDFFYICCTGLTTFFCRHNRNKNSPRSFVWAWNHTDSFFLFQSVVTTEKRSLLFCNTLIEKIERCLCRVPNLCIANVKYTNGALFKTDYAKGRYSDAWKSILEEKEKVCQPS